MKRRKNLKDKYPPSEFCSCEICRRFCARPGWWTVEEAKAAIQAGYWNRMMRETSPDYTFGVLSPAFKGCEMDFAMQRFASYGCTFLKDELCELHGTGLEPLECRFCHHDRLGLGPKCHADLEKDWNSSAGCSLIARWSRLLGFEKRLNINKRV